MIESALAFLFGLLIGSFLNVCVYRLPRDLSVVRPRSHCPACEKQIAWYDNIPVLSYLLLRGKCRHCGERISLSGGVPLAPGIVSFLLYGLIGQRWFSVLESVTGALLGSGLIWGFAWI